MTQNNNTEVRTADSSPQRRTPEPPIQSRQTTSPKTHELRTRYEARLAAQIALAGLKV